ncbi:MAG: bifunctional metallophosphatase/5'-nucleotidase [Chlorobiaceae bacterium]|nr:bifunctional metallophosphatase/5'-nucleotidase [Chlorobiaceae bacterium]
MYPVNMERQKHIRQSRWMLLLIILSFYCAVPAIAGGTTLKVLFTHDLHSYLSPHHESGPDGRVLDVGGFARMAGAVDDERKGLGDGVLLLDAGDFAEGTLFHTVFSDEALELRLMGALGYDAVTFGNHDFDFYPSGLAAMLRTARSKAARLPSLVLANLRFSANDPRDAGLKNAFREYPVRDYVVLERNGLRIGVFGLLGKDAAEDSPFAAPLGFVDPVEAAKPVVRLLKEREKVDLVVCLSHGGTSPVRSHSEDEKLAAAVPGIDLIISGHTHTILPKPKVVGNTIIVSSGPYGARLGVLSLRVDKGGRVAVTGYRLRTIDAGVPEDPGIARQVAGFQDIVERRYLSHFGYRFDQVLANIPFDAPTLNQLYLHPGENGLGNLVTDAYRFAVKRAEGEHYRRVDAAIDVLGCIRSPLLRGDVTTEDAFQTASLGPVQQGYCGNTLVAPYVTGEELKSLLEVETSLAPMKKDGHLSVSGIRFGYNPNRMLFDRVTSVELQGDDGSFTTVQDGRLYRVVVNSYLARLVGLISTKSHGIIKVAFRDAQGNLATNLDQLIVQDGDEALREWVALARYLSSFPVRDGRPEVPERYARAEGRIVVAASWNPVDLVAGGNWLTWSAFALVVAILTLCAFGFSKLFSRFGRRING